MQAYLDEDGNQMNYLIAQEDLSLADTTEVLDETRSNPYFQGATLIFGMVAYINTDFSPALAS